MAKVAPAPASKRRATSTSATWAQERRSSRLTCAGSEIRAATAFTAYWASARCSVTRASTGGVDGDRAGRDGPAWGGDGRDGFTPPISASHESHLTPLGNSCTELEHSASPSSGCAEDSPRDRWAATPPAMHGTDDERSHGGLPAPVDPALARAGAPGPAAVQGGGEAVPHRLGQEPVAAADRPRDRGGPRPAAHPRGRACRGRRDDRLAARPAGQPLAADPGRVGRRPLGRPAHQAPRDAAGARQRAARSLRRQPRPDRQRPGRDRRGAAHRAAGQRPHLLRTGRTQAGASRSVSLDGAL